MVQCNNSYLVWTIWNIYIRRTHNTCNVIIKYTRQKFSTSRGTFAKYGLA